jgi:3-oxoacyl-[acyl-carrier protein] reductase
MKVLESKTAWVTGASYGIGRAIADALREAGYAVVTLQRGGGDVACDLYQTNKIEQVWQAAERVKGIPDLLILNAGACVDDEFVHTRLPGLQAIFALNVFSPILLARLAIRRWQEEQREGHIIFIGSQAALPGAKHTGNTLYTAAKGALHAIIGPLAWECGQTIRINCIAPGDVMTPGEEKSLQTRSTKTGTDVTELIALAAKNTALKRWVKPEEVAQAVFFLEQCTAMTGTILNLSAGATIH